MTNDAPERIWVVTEPHHSGKGPPHVYASASPTKGIPFVPEDDKEAAVAAAYEDVRATLGEIYARDGYMSPELKAIHDRMARACADTDALERVRHEAKAEALRDLLDLKWTCFHNLETEVDVVSVHDILALIPDQHKEGG